MRKSIGIYTNKDKDIGLNITRRLVFLLKSCDLEVFLHRDISEHISDCRVFDEKDEKLFDTLLTVGGDGTILRIAEYCARHDIAILGINLGTVGFLNEIELGAIEDLPKLLKENKFTAENRSLLKVNISGKDYYALNEIVISRDFADRMIRLEVCVDDRLADRYYCDGFIVSTPTGSTAYSLSAGGCVLAPEVNAFSLLAINSHSMHSRPIVISDKSNVAVSVMSAGKDCAVICDGRQVGNISAGNILSVSKATEKLSFLRLKKSNFYEKLLSKLNTWSVTPK